MSINSDISWNFNVQRLCQNMYYHLFLSRRLHSKFLRDLPQVYKNYIQPRLDYGITLYGCSTQKNIDLVQRVQNHTARLITGNFDCMSCHGLYLVKSLTACVITWFCTDSPLQDCYTVLMMTSNHPTHSNTGAITVDESSCTHSFPHNDPIHGFGDECVQYYSPLQRCPRV